jgi:LDH2 family malate/lactate/ureidoglycolate dehydrogenase
VKPDIFISTAEFQTRMETLVRRVHGCPTAEGSSEIFMPGELEAREEARRRRRGIPYNITEVAELNKEAAKLGIEPLFLADGPLA